jgi:hypothetical protein
MMDMEVVFGVLLHAIHLITGALLAGTAFYSWLTGTPIARALKGPILASCGFVIISGGYTLMTKTVTPPGYHMWFGIKMLVVMHILAVQFLLAIQEMPDEKRVRLAKGIAMSSIAAFVLSAILRAKTLGGA